MKQKNSRKGLTGNENDRVEGLIKAEKRWQLLDRDKIMTGERVKANKKGESRDVCKVTG